MPCEMCGRPGPTRRVLIDKTVMTVCAECAKFGKPIGGSPAARPGLSPTVAEGLERRRRRMGSRKDVFADEAMAREMVEDFGDRIQHARQKKGWTREELGSRVKQPVNAVAQFEAGTLHPPDEAAKLLERELGIQLFEKVSPAVPAGRQNAARGLTLGDMIKRKLEPDEEK